MCRSHHSTSLAATAVQAPTLPRFIDWGVSNGKKPDAKPLNGFGMWPRSFWIFMPNVQRGKGTAFQQSVKNTHSLHWASRLKKLRIRNRPSSKSLRISHHQNLWTASSAVMWGLGKPRFRCVPPLWPFKMADKSPSWFPQPFWLSSIFRTLEIGLPIGLFVWSLCLALSVRSIRIR